jgi:hypothetical protein
MIYLLKNVIYIHIAVAQYIAMLCYASLPKAMINDSESN